MSDIAISVNNVSKKYHLYDSPQHRMMEALHPLRKKYHHDFHALENINFVVRKGQTLGIIGRNGSGKSTLLKIISGILTPSSGNVEVNGRLAALLELGAGFNPELSGIENIYFNGTFMGITREEMDQRLGEILSFADIGEFVHQPVKTYSSGMFVRLAFAVAVCVEPEILIVDEALAVGDMAFQFKCLDRLNTLREKGVTILLVTHDIMLTRNYCEQVVYLQNGSVALVGDAETVGEAYIKDARKEIQKVPSDFTAKTEQKSPIRFGSGDGHITSVEVFDSQTGLPVCVQGSVFTILVCAKIKKSIMHPAIHIQIRDIRGYVLYGTFTKPDEILKCETEDSIEVKAVLSLRAILQSGEYGVTVSLNNAYGEMTQVILDKQVAATTFTVFSNASSRVFHGAVNLEAVWDKV